MRSPSRRSRRAVRSRLVALAGAVLLLAGLLPVGAVAPVLAAHTPAPTSVTIAGNLQSEAGCAGDWDPGCAATHLAFDPNDQVWQATFALPAGTYEYKAALNDAWTENYGANAAPDGANIALTVGDANATKFLYSHATHWVTSNRNAVIATAAGSFQSELGCSSDWAPDCLRSWLQDPDGNGTYTFTTDAIAAGNYEVKAAISEGWTENYGAGGIPNGDNIPFTVADDDSVTFSYDATSHVLTVTVEGPPPPPATTVALAGSLQSELGCSSDWDPACEATELTLGGDGIWRGDFTLPAGNYEYKVALNDSWDVNYGAGAAPNGGNIALNLAEGATVRFYFDPDSHWVTSNRNAKIATAAGNFQSEVGCSADWSPSCLRSWLQDIDADGTYTYATDDLPAGSYEFKVAINEDWPENYGAGGVAGGPNIPFTVADGDAVTISYTPANGNAISATVEGSEGPEPGDEALALASLRERLTDEVFYFVMADRFENGSAANDTGGLAGGKLDHGLDPADKGFYHGGDIAGLRDRLEYLDDLGVTAIWMTPMFRNRPVQGEGADASAGYHGYWITDFTQVDPHFGTNAELAALVDEAHGRGMKVFFDIITNHTADVIDYAQGQQTYRNKTLYPYADADGNAFDDRDYAGTGTFPDLNLESFPYTPVVTPDDEDVKAPAWLNDLTRYHNRGDSTFAGESSEYGDFVGLDDLFTEHPDVVDGMIDIHKTWVTDVGIDGFRIDTVKHVNLEFWQSFSPALLDHAADEGNDDFFMFGEVFDGNPSFTSTYSTKGELPAVLDFPFQGAARSFASSSGGTNVLRDLFAQDDWYTDADSNAYNLPTFLGNHDMGRIGFFLRSDNPGASDAELLARSKLAHALMYVARGMPVIYYGDEQGFTGDGGDKDARQDMFPSDVASYNDDDLIGTTATTADENFDTAHPLFDTLNDLAALREAHPALADGAQVHRYSSSAAGIYALSRMDRDEKVEYVIALNNAESAKTQAIQTFQGAGAGFTSVYPEGLDALTTDADGRINVSVPPLGFAIYRANAPLAASTAAPNVTIAAPADGAEVTGRSELRATLSRDVFAEVTFAVKVGNAAEWSVIGTDDNAPYRVFFDTTGIAPDTQLRFKAVVRDVSGNIDADTSTAVVGEIETPPPPPSGASVPDYAVVHYQRSDGSYGDHTTGDYNDFWGLHLWGDVASPTDWTAPVAFQGEDAYGRFAWVKLNPNAGAVNFIVHRGDTKDPTNSPDRSFDPSETPEIWLRAGDATIYASEAAAQGFVEIHYQREDTDYADVTLNGAAPDDVDDYGAVWRLPLAGGDPSAPVPFSVEKAGVEDNSGSVVPLATPVAWLVSDDPAVYETRGAALDYATIHYHRDDGAYGDPTSASFNDFWGMHVWTGAASPNGDWTTPVRPAGTDGFGIFFEVPLVEGAPGLNYIIHRGDTKDPNPDQFLDVQTFGNEVWYLSGHADTAGIAKYVLPIPPAAAADTNLAKQRAHWLREDVLAWDIEPIAGGEYALVHDPEGDLEIVDGDVENGIEIPLTRIPAGVPTSLWDAFPHLTDYLAFRVPAAHLDEVPAALTGQLALVARDASGGLLAATGVQIPGVLDDLYANDAELGVTWAGGNPTLRLWAPTAKSVTLRRFADATGTGFTSHAMTRDDPTGVWSVTGTAGWKGQFYLYDVEVYAPSTGQIEHNLVTDPYSLSLATNSSRTQIVDLADATLRPSGWTQLRKPRLANPESISLYELHIRDFSINDTTVPAALRGTYGAFTLTDSDGMEHLADLADAGLSHVHLLPAFDIATVDEIRANHEEPPCDLHLLTVTQGPASEAQQACVGEVTDKDGFNWGYDPYHYTTPEGSYATNPSGSARTREFRAMVQSLNRAGLRVVMDVVYNHTNAAGQAEKSVLDRIVPGYYHRLLDDGSLATSTCCANTATEHAMMEKLMVDSIVTWARDYKVDGFRFDLMGHHSKANMLAVRAALDGLTLAQDGVDGSKIYLYGEGWNFGEVADDARFVQATQLNMDGTGIGTFSDRLRDAVRGGGPFDSDHRLNQGFGSGLYTDPNEAQTQTPAQLLDRLLLAQDQIKVGLAGNLQDFEFTDRFGNVVDGSEVDYNGSPAGYTSDPQEVITYVEAHDNETLFDSLAYKLPQDATARERARAQVVSLSTVALAQGVPFFHAGAELLRSKSLDRNSYDSGDWFNRIFWDQQANNFGVGLPLESVNGNAWDTMDDILANEAIAPDPSDIAWTNDRFEELLEIRSSSPLFRLGTAAEIQARLSFANNGPNQTPGLIVMRLSDTVGADLDRRVRSMVVVINASDTSQSFALSDTIRKRFRLHDAQAGSGDAVVRSSTFDRRTGTFAVPAWTTAVYVEPQGDD